MSTAAAIFASQGKLAFLASLAKGAYNLVAGEPVSDATNDVSPNASSEYARAAASLTLLTATQLPALAPGSGTAPFTLKGLQDGMYVNGNAAALLGRADDALFLSFRGTNDNGPVSISTDRDQWTDKEAYFDLFADLFSALDGYLAANPGITTVYVTGHSLGAAMVQPFLAYADANYPGVAIEGVAFATPGYGLGFDAADARITNIWNSYDIIRGAAWLSQVKGDQNFIDNGITGALVSHSMDLYLAEVRFMAAEGVGFDQLHAPSWNGAEYDSIYMRVIEANSDLGIFNAGTANDVIVASSLDDIVMGGVGSDRLYGGAGRDVLLGGSGNDKLYGDNGKDTLQGGAGRDKLTGGDHRDILTGGSGRDVFDFNDLSDSGRSARARDVITDFRHGYDDIDLRSIDANSRFFAFGNQAFKFIGKDGFHGIEGELRFQIYNAKGTANDKTLIEGDTDGNSRADFRIELSGLVTLTKGDFLL